MAVPQISSVVMSPVKPLLTNSLDDYGSGFTKRDIRYRFDESTIVSLLARSTIEAGHVRWSSPRIKRSPPRSGPKAGRAF